MEENKNLKERLRIVKEKVSADMTDLQRDKINHQLICLTYGLLLVNNILIAQLASMEMEGSYEMKEQIQLLEESNKVLKSKSSILESKNNDLEAVSN